jgi:hypothetical protein
MRRQSWVRIEGFLTGSVVDPNPSLPRDGSCSHDIVGSTERMRRRRDKAWSELVRRHRTGAAIRRELRPDPADARSTTAGDGFLATFDGACPAVRAPSPRSEAVAELGLGSARAWPHWGVELGRKRRRPWLVRSMSARASPGCAERARCSCHGPCGDLVSGSGIVFQMG